MTDQAGLKERIEAAQLRMMELAANFQQVLPPIYVANLFAGTLVGLLMSSLGREKAAEYLTELAVELNVLNQDSPQRPN
jgi:hypothetical protein